MKRNAPLAVRRPLFFSLLTLLLFLGIVIATGILVYPVEGTATTAWVEALLMGGGALLLFLLARRLGWLATSGISRRGSRRAWLILLPFILWSVAAAVFAFFQDQTPQLPPAGLAAAITVRSLVDGGLLQEFAFRGLIFTALFLGWGHSRRGLLAAVLVSALLFGLVHATNLLAILIDPASTESVTLVGLQMVETTLSGIVMAVFVRYAGSIWPAALRHGLINGVVSVLAVGTVGFTETTNAWLLFMLLNVPVYGLALYLLGRLPLSAAAQDEEASLPGALAAP